jgi:hypothetical protein
MTARLSDLPHRQFEHLVVFVGDVEVAGGVHRPTPLGRVEARSAGAQPAAHLSGHFGGDLAGDAEPLFRRVKAACRRVDHQQRGVSE